jgi:mannose-1-phosphate guanylyltransferase
VARAGVAGGEGSRLWPLSTASRPKPFRALFGREPAVAFVAQQCRKWLGSDEAVALSLGRGHLGAAAEAIPTIARHRLLVEERLEGTTVAIARAAVALLAERADTVLVVLAADQRLSPDRALFAALDDAVRCAQTGRYLVSVGVRPDRPSSAYGYMQLGAPLADVAGAFAGDGYCEKPAPLLAERLFAAGRSLWNAGVFAFRVDALVAALRRFMPALVAAIEQGTDLPRSYRAIDHELMERIADDDPQRAAFVAARCAFDDLGNLEALTQGRRDARGNLVRGEAVLVACEGCTVLSEPPGRVRVAGLRDADVAVGSERNVLVSRRTAGPEATTRTLLLTRGQGVFAEVRSRGIEVRVSVDDEGVSIAAASARTPAIASSGLELRRCHDEEEAAAAMSATVVDTLRAAIERRGHAVWIASTGRTMVAGYARLAATERRSLDWRRVEVVQMDELLDVPEAMTGRRFLRQHLLEPLGIERCVLLGSEGCTDAASLASIRAVERRLGRAADGRADLVVHGLGENGHLGLNEPGSPLDGKGGLVPLTEETRVPRGLTTSRAVTLGLATLLAVSRSVLVVTGSAKREALRRALYEPVTTAVPASALQLHTSTLVIADASALSAT